MAYIRAAGIVRVGRSKRTNGISSAELQSEEACHGALKISYDADCGIPVFGEIAVENGGKPSGVEGDVRVYGDREIVQAADSRSVWGAVHPRGDIGCDRGSGVGSFDL